MQCLRYIFLFCFYVFAVTSLYSQPEPLSDSSQYQNTVQFFYNTINASAHIYSGKEYYRYEPGIKGFPFFLNDDIQAGDIFYDGTLYKNVLMKFDEVRQVVIINDYNRQDKMQLLTEKIEYFTISGHRFETVSQLEGAGSNITKGLYDIMYAGKVSVLIKRIKKIKKGLRAEDPYSFTEEDEYFIKKGKNLFSINNQNGVMNALDDKKDQVKSFIKKNKLRFKKHVEEDAMQVAAYYSSLN